MQIFTRVHSVIYIYISEKLYCSFMCCLLWDVPYTVDVANCEIKSQRKFLLRKKDQWTASTLKNNTGEFVLRNKIYIISNYVVLHTLTKYNGNNGMQIIRSFPYNISTYRYAWPPHMAALLFFYRILAVPGHALLWLIPANWKRTKRKEAHVSNMFNFPMLVGIQYFLWFHLLCR
jgi:hypothetical protein